MSMRLYELTDQLNELLSMDDIPEEQIKDTLDLIREDFDEKAERVAAFIKEIELDSEALKSEVDRLTIRKKSIDNKASYLKDYLRYNMVATGTTKIKGKLFSISLGKPVDVLEVNVSPDLLPDNLCRVVRSADNALIKKMLKDGEEIKGCILTEGKPRLTIK
ncbi:hypothetical protein vBYenSP400_74 [Yersinia phage vB_YenS_P400]|nr:hypothetical protein vBYenSP400_74 [Yersinia phage vB_YenS_P400]